VRRSNLPKSEQPRLRIGVSSCLLGERVRYDGGHKRNKWIARTLARHFELVPVCPEVAIGLGVPRPPIRLVLRAGKVRAVGVHDPLLDVSHALTRYGREMAVTLDDLCGYVFKARSPSCSVAGIAVKGARETHAGLYAAAFLKAHPLLPVEDEERLQDAALRRQFLARVRAYALARGRSA
jgi:uncharacterized protein YbbK (DUF523 family)